MEFDERDKKVERPKKIAVVDASVAVKWFVEEEFTRQALRVIEDYESQYVDIRSMQSMPFEVLNALRYNPELGETEIEKAADALSRLRIALYPVLGDLKELCMKAAFKHGLSVYDASYLSLSRLLNSSLYTADEKFIAKTKEEGTVRHIREYPA